VLGRARRRHAGSAVTSALSDRGLAELRTALLERLRDLEEEVWVSLPLSDARALALLHERGAVLERHFRNGRVEVRFAGRRAEVERLRREGVVGSEDPS